MERLLNGFQHPFGILEHVAVLEAKRADAMHGEQMLVAVGVVQVALNGVVWLAVKLHGEACLGTVEVEHIRPNGKLSAELLAHYLTGLEHFPHRGLGGGAVGAEFATEQLRGGEVVGAVSTHALPPAGYSL